LYAFGGSDEADKLLKSIEVLDLVSMDKWNIM